MRSFRPGAHAPRWASLLDDLTAAKDCLLDPARKQQYDEQLRRELEAADAEAARNREVTAENVGSTSTPPEFSSEDMHSLTR